MLAGTEGKCVTDRSVERMIDHRNRKIEVQQRSATLPDDNVVTRALSLARGQTDRG